MPNYSYYRWCEKLYRTNGVVVQRFRVTTKEWVAASFTPESLRNHVGVINIISEEEALEWMMKHA